MPLPMIADVIRTSVVGHTAGGHHWANVLHFRKTSILSNSGAIAILDPLLLNFYTTNLGTGLGWQNGAPTTMGIEQFQYTPLDGATATTVITHAFAGTSGGEALPANVALVATLRTALRGRSHRGRIYWNGINENSNTAVGAPLAATVNGLANQCAQFISNLAGSGVTWVVASYLNSTAENITAVSVDTRWDTQRRRLNV